LLAHTVQNLNLKLSSATLSVGSFALFELASAIFDESGLASGGGGGTRRRGSATDMLG
jgi:hypothetical protein